MTTSIARHARVRPAHGVHTPYTAIYADQAERDAATAFGDYPFSAEDLYKKALQLSDDTEWVLVNVSPVTWASVQQLGVASVFGADQMFAKVSAESSSGSTTYQDKVMLTTPAGLVGVYRIAWRAQVGQTSTSRMVETRLYDKTNGETVGASVPKEPKDKNDWLSIGDFDRVVLTGAAVTYAVQYRQQNGSSAKIRNAKIEFWRVA